jgi:hypothetical protein
LERIGSYHSNPVAVIISLAERGGPRSAVSFAGRGQWILLITHRSQLYEDTLEFE